MTQELAAARAIEPVVDEHRQAMDRDRRLPEAVVTAMGDAGLFKLWLPRTLGGPQLDLRSFLEVVEEVSRQDGSAGWSLMVGATYSRLAGYLSEAVARQIWAPRNAFVAGTINPTGKVRRVNDGWSISGRWPYGSGIDHATFVFGNAVVVNENGESILVDGAPDVRTVLFPKSAVEVIDNWHVGGLRGTGSCDFAVRDLFVPDSHVIPAFSARPTQPGTLYAMPIITVFAMSVASVPLGIARAAINATVELASRKIPTGATNLLRDRVMVQSDIGRAEALLRSGRAFLLEALELLWNEVETKGSAEMKTRALLRLACAQAARAASEVVDLMWDLGGATSNFESCSLERCLRDMRAATQHIALVPNNFVLGGRVLLGLPPGTPRF